MGREKERRRRKKEAARPSICSHAGHVSFIRGGRVTCPMYCTHGMPRYSTRYLDNLGSSQSSALTKRQHKCSKPGVWPTNSPPQTITAEIAQRDRQVIADHNIITTHPPGPRRPSRCRALKISVRGGSGGATSHPARRGFFAIALFCFFLFVPRIDRRLSFLWPFIVISPVATSR